MSIIRPGVLVALKTSLNGGVQYTRVDHGSKVDEVTGAVTSEWDTTKTVTDPDEFEAATKARNKASALIRAKCCKTNWGLLCPKSAESALDVALSAAKSICDEFNGSARTCRVYVYALKGQIAATDEEAARSIARDVESILRDMQAGIRNVDAKAIRDAASAAVEMGNMLDETVAARVTSAVEAARKAARAIVREVEKGGKAAEEIGRELRVQNAIIDSARFAFLDRDEPLPVEAVPGVDAQRFAELAEGAARVAEAATAVSDRALDLAV